MTCINEGSFSSNESSFFRSQSTSKDSCTSEISWSQKLIFFNVSQRNRKSKFAVKLFNETCFIVTWYETITIFIYIT